MDRCPPLPSPSSQIMARCSFYGYEQVQIYFSELIPFIKRSLMLLATQLYLSWKLSITSVAVGSVSLFKSTIWLHCLRFLGHIKGLTFRKLSSTTASDFVLHMAHSIRSDVETLHPSQVPLFVSEMTIALYFHVAMATILVYHTSEFNL